MLAKVGDRSIMFMQKASDGLTQQSLKNEDRMNFVAERLAQQQPSAERVVSADRLFLLDLLNVLPFLR